MNRIRGDVDHGRYWPGSNAMPLRGKGVQGVRRSALRLVHSKGSLQFGVSGGNRPARVAGLDGQDGRGC